MAHGATLREEESSDMIHRVAAPEEEEEKEGRRRGGEERRWPKRKSPSGVGQCFGATLYYNLAAHRPPSRGQEVRAATQKGRVRLLGRLYQA